MSQRVLVVDDDSAVRQVTVEALTDSGYECDEATDGAQALELAREHPPDAVVLDVLMPHLSGDDVHQALRLDPRTRYTPVIFISAQGEPTEKVKRLREGADDYLAKPFDIDELAARVETAIRRSEQLRALNPLSGLPGNPAITAELTRRLRSEGWSCLYCDIDRFKAFNDHYGFTRGDGVIVALGLILVEVATSISSEAFVGHVGGDDFVVIVPDTGGEDAAREIVRRFDAMVPALYDAQDRERGYTESPDRRGVVRRTPLASVSLGIVAMSRARFADAVAVSRAAAEVKEVAKRRKGSSWAVDRRKTADAASPQPVA